MKNLIAWLENLQEPYNEVYLALSLALINEQLDLLDRFSSTNNLLVCLKLKQIRSLLTPLGGRQHISNLLPSLLDELKTSADFF